MPWSRFLPLRCGVRHYTWGERTHAGRAPYIARLLGLHPEPHEAFAELWIGAHHGLPSMVALSAGERPLNELIREHPEAILGRPLVAAGVRDLPFLLKVLSCERPLSIQAHPDRALAAELHAGDPKHYPDANHKPEIAVALRESRALCRFRSATAVAADGRRLPALGEYLGLDPEPDPAGDPAWLRQTYAKALALPPADGSGLLARLAAAVRALPQRLPHDDLYLDLLEHYPGDKGALAAYFLNLVTLAPGEGLYMGPNEPHAYLRGTLVECMANSDNVVRAGLTDKHTDDQLLRRMLTYREGVPALSRGEPLLPGVVRYRVPVPDFQLEVWRPGEACQLRLPSADLVSLLVVTNGSAVLRTPRQVQVAATGTAWLWPAALAAAEIDLTADAEVFRALPNPGAAA